MPRSPLNIVLLGFFFLFCLSTSVCASQEKTLGTLIVTYGTGEDSIRLNRVKFWLISQQGTYKLFPNEKIYVDDPITKKRMVLIENLPEGNYTVKFVYPNSDRLFDTVDSQTMTIKGGGVVKIDQDILMRAQNMDTLGSQNFEITYESPYQRAMPPLHEVRFYSLPSRQSVQALGYLNIRSNMPGARWIITREGVKIVAGEGSVKDLALVPASGYKVGVEEIDNYEVKILPTPPITIAASQTSTIEIIYKRILGFIQVVGFMPSSDQIQITIEGGGLEEPLQTTQISRGNQIDWKSSGLPLGTYVMTIKTPSYYEDIPPVKIVLKQGQNVVIKPKLIGANKIQVTTNSSEALFVLKQDIGPLMMEGRGQSYRFEGLFPGTYTLTFSTLDPTRFIPPQPVRFSLSKFKPKEEQIYAEYTYAGNVKITGNIPRFIAKFESKAGNFPPFQEEITQYSKSITLPEGSWRITLTPYSLGKLESAETIREVYLDAFQSEEVSVQFPLTEENIQIQPPPPEPVQVREKNIDDLYMDLISIPEGLSILGNPNKQDTENTLAARSLGLSSFEISRYEVTNGQFATWLNAAYGEGLIFVSKDNPGVVVDSKGRTLFFTMDKVSESQISYSSYQEKNPFDPLPSYENYPVIFVSWYGALAFCDYYSLRLPSEAEWERAAAISGGGQTPLKKWTFGFQKDTIDRRYANYKFQPNAPYTKKVLTTPVGFYNGLTLLPLIAQDQFSTMTENAVSPVGAYDMSGNVFEWVQDWFSDEPLPQPLNKDYQGPKQGKTKIAKGGCYDSTSDGVRSFERIALDPQHLDQFTGFRVAK